MTDSEMMRTFNCGIGIVLVLEKTEQLPELVNKYNLVKIGELESNL